MAITGAILVPGQAGHLGMPGRTAADSPQAAAKAFFSAGVGPKLLVFGVCAFLQFGQSRPNL